MFGFALPPHLTRPPYESHGPRVCAVLSCGVLNEVEANLCRINVPVTTEIIVYIQLIWKYGCYVVSLSPCLVSLGIS